MPTLRLTVTGAEETAATLETVHRRLHEPYTPLLGRLEDLMAESFRQNLLSEGARSATPWPSPHPSTAAIRQHYGHKGPRLIRGGQLLESINTLDRSDRSIAVGSALPYAADVHEGGLIDDGRGGTRTVQAHPFLAPTLQDLDDWDDRIAHYFFQEPFQ